MVTLGEPRDWLGVGKRVHWALDTSNSSKHSWRAVMGQTGSVGGSAGWVTRPVTLLWIYNFGLKYEKGIVGFFLFFSLLKKETLFSTFRPIFYLSPPNTSFCFNLSNQVVYHGRHNGRMWVHIWMWMHILRTRYS